MLPLVDAEGAEVVRVEAGTKGAMLTGGAEGVEILRPD